MWRLGRLVRRPAGEASLGASNADLGSVKRACLGVELVGDELRDGCVGGSESVAWDGCFLRLAGCG